MNGRPVRVKICGVTRAEDAWLAAELGASAIGFIFWPKSPRFIEPEAAARIVETLPAKVTPIGVFVNQARDHVESVARIVGLGAVQLHGQEGREFCDRLLRPVIKAVTVGQDDLDEACTWPPHVTLLIDARDPVLVGGTGRTVDWHAAARIARTRRVLLSGGLRPDNVQAAIRTVAPYGVDAASGVEAAPGVKDSAKLRAFFRAVLDATGIACGGLP
ncbi:MAG: phosphoribosylanthranilate isomerase [Acidobacteria bacterium]|nr:phosphoribosylanthranilate isomerase [Acidobacteriota bacterium]